MRSVMTRATPEFVQVRPPQATPDAPVSEADVDADSRHSTTTTTTTTIDRSRLSDDDAGEARTRVTVARNAPSGANQDDRTRARALARFGVSGAAVDGWPSRNGVGVRARRDDGDDDDDDE